MGECRSRPLWAVWTALASLAVLLVIAGSSAASTRCVGTSGGCDTTHATLDDALAAAAPGDRVIARDQALGPLTLGPLTRDLALDLRMNRWSSDAWPEVQASVLDLGERNSVLQLPFLTSNGEPEPPLPRVAGDHTHSGVEANCEGWDADGDGFGDGFWSNPGGPGECLFLLVQAAIDFAHPGSTVLVPPSTAFPEPTPQADLNVLIDRNNLGAALLPPPDGPGGFIGGAPEELVDLTLCSTTLRSSRCVGDAQAGDWIPERADWAPVPGSLPFRRDLALRVTTLTEPTGLAGFGLVSTSVPGAPQLDDLGVLEFDVMFEGSGCGGGSPRFTLGIDKDGDGDRDKNVFVYAGPFPSFGPCPPMNAWQHHDLLDGVARWDPSQLVGGWVRTQATAHADILAAFPDYRVISAILEWDSAWMSPTGSVQATWFDNIRLNDLMLIEPENHGCDAGLHLGCPQRMVASGAILDGRGMPLSVVDIRADDVLLQGLTVRGPSPAMGFASAVRLGGDGQQVRHNILPGGAQLEALLGSPAPATVGVYVCCHPGAGVPTPASDYLVEGNDISGWRTAGVYVAAANGGPGTIAGNHFHTNSRSGVQSENPFFANRITIEGNEFGPNLLRGIHLLGDVGARIDGNRFDLAIPLTLDPRSGAGILAESSTLTFVGGNTFIANEHTLNLIAAVTLDATPGLDQPDVLFRRNAWRLLDGNTFGLWLTQGVAGQTVDARLEDWGVYNWRLVGLRVMDEGAGNTVQQIPFLLADGTPEPPVPVVVPSSHCSSLGFVPLSVQEALWCAHPATPGLADSWLAVPPSAFSVDPTPRLENIRIETNRELPGLDALGRPLWGAFDEPLDGLIVCSSTHAPPGCGFAAARTILDGSAGSGPAVTLVADDVSVEGFTVRGSSPLLVADGATWTFGATPLINGIKANVFEVQRANADRDGVVLRDTTGAFLTGNTVHANAWPGSVAVDVDGGSGARIALTFIDGAGVGIRFFESTDGLARANTIRLAPRTPGGTLPSYGISLFSGSGHETRFNTLTGPGWGMRIDGTTGVHSDRDLFVDLDAAIELVRLGAATQPDGLVVREATFATPLALHIDATVSGIVADLRLNTWGTDEWRVIQKRFQDDGSGNTVKFLPYRTVTGAIEPPPPVAIPASHCTAAGFQPWNLEDALGCAHAQGLLLLRPPATTPDDPPPYEANLVVDVNSEGEALDGLRLCSAPLGVNDCSQPQAQAVHVRGLLAVAASDVTLKGLTFEGTGTALRAERPVDARHNHWEAYRLSHVRARISGPNAAGADVVPFLDRDARTPILPPQAGFAPSLTTTDRLTPVTFTDASAAGTRPLEAWSWAFGDGALGDGATASHTYGALGDFTARLTVRDEAELTSSATRVLRVVNLPPHAAFTFGPDPANRAEPTVFTDASLDRDGNIASWLWTLPDGTTSTATQASFTFERLGDFPVTLTVTDNDGDTDATTRVVNVVNLAPTPGFDWDPDVPMLLQPVQFDDLSLDLDGALQSWLWDFGDGLTSTDAEPLHAYATGGWHHVTLTVTDADGAARTAARDLYVCAPGVGSTETLLSLEHLHFEFEACFRLSDLTTPL